MKYFLPLFIVVSFLLPTDGFADTSTSIISICKSRGFSCNYRQPSNYNEQYFHGQMKREFENIWKNKTINNTRNWSQRFVDHNRTHRYCNTNSGRTCFIHECVDCFENQHFRQDYQNESNTRYIKKRLRRIIRKAKKRNGADPWVISKLENLLDDISTQNQRYYYR